jgi:hypothetical protein
LFSVDTCETIEPASREGRRQATVPRILSLDGSLERVVANGVGLAP